MYVDDVGIAAPNQKVIDELCAALRAPPHNLCLTQEGKFERFLGIQFNRNNSNITCTQPGLNNKILAATNLADSRPNSTPCTRLSLGSDPDRPPMTESWNYPSVVGMLLYLSTNTRPDITFAVSQVA